MASSKYNGVLWHKSSRKYMSRVGIEGKKKYLGSFDDELSAAICYDNYIKNNSLVGYKLNFPDPEPENLIPNTRLIRLTQGKFAVIDEEDYERINQYNWWVYKGKYTDYAVGSVIIDGMRRVIRMHQFVISGSFSEVDHMNSNGLHNYKSNLRGATKSQNMMNQQVQLRNKSSKHKGVSWNKGIDRFTSYITHNRKRMHIGCFDNEDEAALSYNAKAIELFGEFARLNIIN